MTTSYPYHAYTRDTLTFTPTVTAGHPYESGPFSYYWDFGDYLNGGGWSTSETPTWNYASAGLFTCHLTVTLIPIGQTVDVFHDVSVTVYTPPAFSTPSQGAIDSAASSTLGLVYSTGYGRSDTFEEVMATTDLGLTWHPVSTSTDAIFGPIISSPDGQIIQSYYGVSGTHFQRRTVDGGATWQDMMWAPYDFGIPHNFYPLAPMVPDSGGGFSGLKGSSHNGQYVLARSAVPSQGECAESWDSGGSFYCAAWIQPTGSAQTLSYYDGWFNNPVAYVAADDYSRAIALSNNGPGGLHLLNKVGVDAWGGPAGIYEDRGVFEPNVDQAGRNALKASSTIQDIIVFPSVFGVGGVYVSNDYGATWTLRCNTFRTNQYWGYMACSSDGAHWIITASSPSPTTGYVYFSDDHGITWSEMVIPGTQYYSCQISDDGHTAMIFSQYNSQYIHR